MSALRDAPGASFFAQWSPAAATGDRVWGGDGLATACGVSLWEKCAPAIFGGEAPYQRFWDDMARQITRWADRGVASRPSRATVSGQSGGGCLCVGGAGALSPWRTVGRPDWILADTESQQAWEALLEPLETRGLYRERGLELFIHDGSAGLIAALNPMFPQIPHQRCLFHKLRNSWSAIQSPPTLSPLEARHFKCALLRQLQTVFEAPSASETLRRRDAFAQQWHTRQPHLVATLGRDWPQSVAFFRVLARFPAWPLRFLRTTSLLERVNRMLRRLFRAAAAFHSSAGLHAAVARTLIPLRLS